MKVVKSLQPPKNAVESSSGYTWLDDDGLIIAVASSHQLHTLEHALENHKINMELAAGKPRPFLIDMSLTKSMSKDARAFYAGSEPTKAITAVAILTQSNLGKTVANFFLKLTKQTLPTQMFTDYHEAKIWLSKFK